MIGNSKRRKSPRNTHADRGCRQQRRDSMNASDYREAVRYV